MPRIPISQLDDDKFDDEDLEHDHLGRPVTDRRPKRPDHFNEPSNTKRNKQHRTQEQK